MSQLISILNFAHQTLAKVIKEGDDVVDATAGNGHDTLFLAQLVGNTGKVWAFDIQEQALQITKQRLEQAGLQQRLTTVLASHERIAEYITTPIAAAIFNFGYLPGGDKSLTTQTNSSLSAVQSILQLLKKGGVAVLVVYPGHEEGRVEAQALKDYVSTLSQQDFAVAHYEFLNRKNNPPQVLIIEKY